MPRYRLDLAYEGTGFAGWQAQPGRRTVQGELERTLARLGETAVPTGAGRTDAGVHALGMVAHVDLARDWRAGELEGALRGLVEPDIEILGVRAAPEAFHARYGAASRTYHYALGLEHNLFFRFRRWVPDALPQAAWVRGELECLHGDVDAAALAKAGAGSVTTECRIEAATWAGKAGGAVLTVTADRFLYGMVRALVGTLVHGFRDGAAAGHLERVLQARNRAAAGAAAPPEGLYLGSVQYPQEPGVDREPQVVRLAGLESGLTSGRN